MAFTDADMDGAQIDMKAVLGAVWRHRVRIALVTLLLCVLTYVLLSFVPKTYEASASLLVEPRSNIFLRAANDTGNGATGIADSVLMSSQVELVQSSQTLLQVVRSENLVEVAEFNGSRGSPLDPLLALLGRKSDQRNLEQKVLARLAKKVTVIRERDSRVISILVRSEDRELAARIANALAEAHVRRRAELSLNDTVDASDWLESEIEKLRVRVVEAESAVAAFRIQNDLFEGNNNTSLVDQQLSGIAAQITAAQERGNAARSRADLINGLLSSGQPIDGLADVQNSVVIQRLSENKAQLQGQRAQLLATLLPDHPQIRSITAQIREIDKQVLAEGRRVADALQAEAQIEEALTTSLQEELARLKISASSAATSSVKLQELEREAKAQRDLLETYLGRFRDASARTDTGAALPDVRVISVALAPLSPASPKTALILIAIVIVSVSVQIGSILLSELAVGAPSGREQGRTPPIPDGYLKVPSTAEGAAKAVPSHRAPIPPKGRADWSENTALSSARLQALLEELERGGETTLILAALDSQEDCNSLGQYVLERLMEQGRTVAVVDAQSREISEQPGISDLSAGQAEFGEVVFGNENGDLTEVFWGRLPDILPQSDRPGTLVEALADICEIVVVFAEKVSKDSSLPVFSGVDATLVLVAEKAPARGEVEALCADAHALGFKKSVILVAPEQKLHVA
ncbi:MAG TPA: hypothetical protein ENJ90_03375 [Devosia sp.]|nr:hypothetical protein [Devosia sp.]